MHRDKNKDGFLDNEEVCSLIFMNPLLTPTSDTNRLPNQNKLVS